MKTNWILGLGHVPMILSLHQFMQSKVVQINAPEGNRARL